MVSEKPWRPEAVLLLGARIFVLFFVCMLGVSILQWRGYSPQSLALLVGTLVVQSMAIVMIHFFLRYHGMTWSQFLGLRHRRVLLSVLFALGTAMVATPLALGANYLSARIITLLHRTPEQQIVIKMLEQTEDSARRTIFALAAIVMAPLVEETVFRGILYPLLKFRGYPRLAIWVTSLLFAAVHVNLMSFVPLFLFALVLIWIYERTDTLLAPIAAHACFNTINFLLFVNQQELEHWLVTLRERI